MNVLLFLKSQFRKSAGVFWALTLLLTLSLAMAVAVVQTEKMIKDAGIRAADRFDILVGARGSSTALLAGTVYLKDEMLPLVPMSAMKDIEKRPGDAVWIAPLAFGDRAGDSVLVGTTADFVTQGGTLKPAHGRVFAAPDEAVAGALAGLRTGDEFRPSHGRASAGRSPAHEEVFHVTGVAAPTGTPWDRAVMIPIEAIWSMHGFEHDGKEPHDHQEAQALRAPAQEPLEHWMKEDLSRLPGASAFAVKPANIAAAYRIRQHVLSAAAVGPDGKVVNLMAVFTGEVLVELLSMFDSAAKALKSFAGASALLALLAALLTGFVLAQTREAEFKLLRTLGAPAKFVFTAVWCAVMSVIAAAVVLSAFAGTAATEIIAFLLSNESGIAMHVTPSSAEFELLLSVLAAGAAFAVVPAWLTGRRELF